MFRKSYNRAVLRIRVDTVTPLLIRAGDAGLDPTAVDLTCVRTRHGRHGLTVYIPGSSLKGVLRAAAEAGVRGRAFAGAGGEIEGACEDPLDHNRSCGGRLSRARRQDGASTASIHRGHCLACRLFGSLAMKGRIAVRDLLPWPEDAADPDQVATTRDPANHLEARPGVAIDRILGSVRHGPFDQEMVPAGVSFWGDIALENYQVWQLGLLAAAFDQVNHGMAQLGSSKSRGLGVARIAVERMVHEQAGAAGAPAGVYQLARPEERSDYGLLPEDPLPATSSVPRGLATRFEVDAQVAHWLDAGLRALGSLPAGDPTGARR